MVKCYEITGGIEHLSSTHSDSFVLEDIGHIREIRNDYASKSFFISDSDNNQVIKFDSKWKRLRRHH